jgi:hypothetical protein
MKIAWIVSALLLCAAPVFGQNDPARPAEKPAEAEAPTSLGISAEIAPFIRKLYPEIDPAGEHDVFALKNYTDPARRHAYTDQMTRLLLVYIQRLDLGSTLSKVFDQYSRGKHGGQPTFKVLHAVQLLHYPPGVNNWQEAEKLLREAAAQAPDYAYAWYLVAQIELGKLSAGMVSSPASVTAAVDAALKIKPDFVGAVLIKAELMLKSRPPKEAEALKLIEPHLAKVPDSPTDLEGALRIYGAAATRDAMLKQIEEIAKRPGLGKQHRYTCFTLAATACNQVKNFDGALEWMEKARAAIDIEVDPDAMVRSARAVGDIWGMKAARIVEKDPRLQGESRAQFDACVAEARRYFLEAVELERKHMPIELRGREAMAYGVFLYNNNYLEDALLWLNDYLAKTDLPANIRNSLESLQLRIRTLIDPNEEIQVEQYEDLRDRREDTALLLALQGAIANLETRGIHFKTERALRFFLGELKHKDRRIVELCARLGADTARTAGGESIAEAGKALADRFEQEIECKSAEQASLQIALCKAILLTDERGTGHAPSQARAARHLKKLVDALPENSVGIELGKVVAVFTNREFQSAIKDAPRVPSSLQRNRRDAVSEWLGKLAETLEKPPEKEG